MGFNPREYVIHFYIQIPWQKENDCFLWAPKVCYSLCDQQGQQKKGVSQLDS